MKNQMVNSKSQKGFTLVELIIVIAFAVIGLGVTGTVGYVAWHFISKFW